MIDSVKLENVPCPLGCELNDKQIMSGRDLINYLPGEYSIVKCRTCGLMRTTPRPTIETMWFYYPDDYGPYMGTRVNQIQSKSRFKRILRWLASRVFDFKTMALPSIQSGRLLEVGCASGAFLHQMKSEGWYVEGKNLTPCGRTL